MPGAPVRCFSASAAIGPNEQAAVEFAIDGRNAALSWRKLYDGVISVGPSAAADIEQSVGLLRRRL